MNHYSVSIIIINLLLLCSAFALRVSPKLDFGESNTKTLGAGVRPETEVRYLKDRSVTKSDHRIGQTEPTKVKNIEVVCISGNCSTKATTEVENGISADVLVHVKTNVDYTKIKNNTIQQVPDVPIVIGTKTSTAPTFIGNRPNSVGYGSNYPAINILPPVSTNDAFIPTNRREYPPLPTGSVFVPTGSVFAPTSSVFVPTRRDYVQNPQLQPDSQIITYPGFNNYASGYQGISNDINLQTTYFGSSFNSNNFNNNNFPSRQQQTWRPKVNRGGTYNPVEFRKTYSNTWTPVKWSRSDSSNSDRRTGSGIPRWTPCVCQNPEVHHYQTTPTYIQHGEPSGISGKIAPLV